MARAKKANLFIVTSSQVSGVGCLGQGFFYITPESMSNQKPVGKKTLILRDGMAACGEGETVGAICVQSKDRVSEELSSCVPSFGLC
jgi:hypothetical protein